MPVLCRLSYSSNSSRASLTEPSDADIEETPVPPLRTLTRSHPFDPMDQTTTAMPGSFPAFVGRERESRHGTLANGPGGS